MGYILDRMTGPKIGTYRWRILALLFMATTINYMDRSILGVLGPTLRDHVFGWTNQQYSAHQHLLQDRLRPRPPDHGRASSTGRGRKKATSIPSGRGACSACLHALVTRGMGWIGFAVARFGLGIGESGNFPACIKTIAEWFPKRERALATGIFNAGTNVGVILTPLIISLIVGRRRASAGSSPSSITAVFSAIWIVLWLRIYRKPEVHPRLSRRRAGLHPERLRARDRREDALVPGPAGQARPGPSPRPRFPDAVWFFYLFWGDVLPERPVRPVPQGTGPAADRHLSLRRLRQRRPAAGCPRPSSSGAGRSIGPARRRCSSAPWSSCRSSSPRRRPRLGGRGPHRPGRGRPPGLVGQRLHPGLGRLSRRRPRPRSSGSGGWSAPRPGIVGRSGAGPDPGQERPQRLFFRLPHRRAALSSLPSSRST